MRREAADRRPTRSWASGPLLLVAVPTKLFACGLSQVDERCGAEEDGDRCETANEDDEPAVDGELSCRSSADTAESATIDTTADAASCVCMLSAETKPIRARRAQDDCQEPKRFLAKTLLVGRTT